MKRESKRLRVPRFESFTEEARFWDTHEVTEFSGELTPAQLRFSKPRRRLVSMRLPESEITGLKRIAARKGVGYLTLIRMWVTERFFKELGKI